MRKQILRALPYAISVLWYLAPPVQSHAALHFTAQLAALVALGGQIPLRERVLHATAISGFTCGLPFAFGVGAWLVVPGISTPALLAIAFGFFFLLFFLALSVLPVASMAARHTSKGAVN